MFSSDIIIKPRILNTLIYYSTVNICSSSLPHLLQILEKNVL